MLEKSSTVVLTEQDINDYKLGLVTDRVKQTWGFTLEQLKEIVDKKDYKIINDNK
jgi:hypothetical protein